MSALLLWILAAPLAAFLLLSLIKPRKGGDWVSLVAMTASFGLSLKVATSVLSSGLALAGPSFAWLSLPTGFGIPAFSLSLGLRLDSTGAVMLLIVTGLALCVEIFSTWYMHGDRHYSRFFSHFSFFCFAMLGIVLSDNLLMTFVFWELVGVGSYLLIGFWHEKPAVADDPFYQEMKASDATGILETKLSPSHAQLKAFVMNRVGDFGFLVGLGIFAWAALAAGLQGDILSWDNLRLAVNMGAFDRIAFAGLSGSTLLTLAGIGVFLGAMGKSAQFPLHTWLPDAMQGPTTASSIIHAATMVAAGVFLTARIHPLLTPDALLFVSWIGAITAIVAASIAMVQWDFKAVLAYSTVSQLGYMMIGLGAGAATGGYTAGLSHLFTHALFKCLLFLGAASIIHGCANHQDINRFGGLAKKMPVTALATGLAVLAICGLPFFSAFWSKDAIVASAWLAAQERSLHGSTLLAWGPWMLAVLSALLTSFYMTRLWTLTFLGKERDHHVTHHAHDPSFAAKAVLLVLSLFTLQFVWTGSVNPFGTGSWLDNALLPVGAVEHLSESVLHHAHVQTMILATILGMVGIGAALFLYRKGPVAFKIAPVWNFLANLWFIDKLWDLLWVEGLGKRGGKFVALLDLGSDSRLSTLETAPRLSPSLDGAVDGTAHFTGRLGSLLGRLQNGNALSYAGYTTLALGLLVLLLVI
ncbi:MAG: hypothetical protein RL318_790 [Fibrobacterota bacterium]|jgi:NADH-quinone oxidoreductase subunit L